MRDLAAASYVVVGRDRRGRIVSPFGVILRFGLASSRPSCILVPENIDGLANLVTS